MTLKRNDGLFFLIIPDEIIKKNKISSQTLELIEKVHAYDLSLITQSFNDDGIRNHRPFKCEQAYPIIKIFGRADFEIAKRLEIEFKRFVILTLLKPNIPISPPGPVDMYWHFFILNSKNYFEFCKLVWNSDSKGLGYKHHNHYKDKTVSANIYGETLTFYKDIFGEAEPFRTPEGKEIPIWNVGPYECYPGGDDEEGPGGDDD